MSEIKIGDKLVLEDNRRYYIVDLFVENNNNYVCLVDDLNSGHVIYGKLDDSGLEELEPEELGTVIDTFNEHIQNLAQKENDLI